jgi:hypothetical protein
MENNISVHDDQKVISLKTFISYLRLFGIAQSHHVGVDELCTELTPLVNDDFIEIAKLTSWVTDKRLTNLLKQVKMYLEGSNTNIEKLLQMLNQHFITEGRNRYIYLDDLLCYLKLYRIISKGVSVCDIDVKVIESCLHDDKVDVDEFGMLVITYETGDSKAKHSIVISKMDYEESKFINL